MRIQRTRLAAFFRRTRGLKGRLRRVLERAITLPEVIVIGAIIAVLAITITPNLLGAQDQAGVSVCESNLRAISTAAELYWGATGTYPTGSGASVTTALFQNPNVTTVTYLDSVPVDPADATGAAAYKWTYTAPTATVAGFYTIVCPGVHPKETLQKVPNGASETTGTIQLDSRTGFKAL